MKLRLKTLLFILCVLLFCSCMANQIVQDCPDMAEDNLIVVPTIGPIPEGFQSERAIEEHDGMTIGNQIIVAIEKYFIEYGTYPENLDALSPCFIDEIPITSTGQEYRYLLKNEDNPYWPYLLMFESVSGKWGCAYHARKSLWECGLN